MSQLTFIQYGDFSESWHRFAAGGSETYPSQRASVDYVERLVESGWSVAVIDMATDTPTDHILPCGIRVIGLGPQGPAFGTVAWTKILDDLSPDALVVRTPVIPVLAWAKRRRCRTLALLADSFQGSGFKTTLYRWRLFRLLKAVETVANHGQNAARALIPLGIPAAKVIAWDWPPSVKPVEPPKTAPQGAEFELFYAGGISEAKGVTDLLEAVRLLRAEGRAVSLSLCGKDYGENLAAHAEDLVDAGAVRFEGLVPSSSILDRMRAADAVVVPSRHYYPEGLPLTIYEAYCSRSPLLASDHPMFAGNVVDGKAALVFPAADPRALAAAIVRLIEEPALYARLSAGSADAWAHLQLPVKWEGLLDHWLAEDRQWLADWSIAGGRY